MSLHIEGYPYEVDCLIVPDLREEVILGQEWLRDNDAVVDLARFCIHLGTHRRQTVHWHQASSTTLGRNLPYTWWNTWRTPPEPPTKPSS